MRLQAFTVYALVSDTQTPRKLSDAVFDAQLNGKDIEVLAQITNDSVELTAKEVREAREGDTLDVIGTHFDI